MGRLTDLRPLATQMVHNLIGMRSAQDNGQISMAFKTRSVSRDMAMGRAVFASVDAGYGASYAGDVDPASALAAVSDGAIIVDVRTRAEWTFVGLPKLGRTQLILSEWQHFPDMHVSPNFVTEIAARLSDITGSGAVEDAPPLYFLCRSGARSQAAAIAMTQAGFKACFNISGGFEGDPDGQGHRGKVNGWKADGLPWIQN